MAGRKPPPSWGGDSDRCNCASAAKVGVLTSGVNADRYGRPGGSWFPYTPGGGGPRIPEVDNELLEVPRTELFYGGMLHYPTEPEVLARELGITGKRLRGWLRSRHPRSDAEHGGPWVMSRVAVDEARARFGRDDRPVMPGFSAVTQSELKTDLSALSRRKEAAAKYRPSSVRLLLVAEAPPAAEDRYFYFDDVNAHDSLFRYVVRGVLGVEPSRSGKPSLLEDLRARGVFLIDVAEEPGRAASLEPCVPGLLERCKALSPAAIVLIKATVYDAAFLPLRRAGFNVIDRRIPFPGSGQQRRFEAEFAAALQEAP